MKRISYFFFCCLIALFACKQLYAEDSYCKNLGFELGDFTNWTGYTWLYSTDVTSINTSEVQGIVYRRQTIMKDTTAYDANTGDALRIVPSGYCYSARLGDEIKTNDPNPRCWEQSLRYTLTVDSANALLEMKFACVLQYASDHTEKMEPRFRVTLFDQRGDTIPDCANYDVFSSNLDVDGFQSYTPAGSTDPVKWRDWTTVGANLLNYIGQTITIEFMSADCTGRYHFGYAYFVAACHPMSISVKYCAGDSSAILLAPEGFETYHWSNGSGSVVGSKQKLEVVNPTEGEIFSCEMTSATGCSVTLQSTIIRYELIPVFDSYMLDCASNRVQFTNTSTTTHGSLIYKWDFGDGVTSSEKNPQYKFATSGMHAVSLELSSPQTACTKILNKEIESFSPPLVGIGGDSTYCPNLATILKAYGAYQYLWSNGSQEESVTVRAPGGEYWLLGHSSTGCVSDTNYITVSEEPDWQFKAVGDSVFCMGDSSILLASGAADYLWTTGDTTSSVIVKAPGIYTVTGENVRGCEKTKSIYVVVNPLPDVGFTLSSPTVNVRHNQINCVMASPFDVEYEWDMGDGSTETGATISHTYTIANETLDYTISLRATSEFGCVDSSSKTIDVIPFIPNVFSPNGDGINDVFMSGMELQVFDRNGILLYKGIEGWDGTFHGRSADPDTYFYLIRYTDKNKQVQTPKGYITLVR
jgi:gliding motility-associated-like protein